MMEQNGNVTGNMKSQMPSVYNDISELLKVVYSKLWIIVLVTAIGLVATYVISDLQTPVYESTSSFVLTPNVEADELIRSLNNISMMVGTYSHILRSRNVGGAVRDELRQEFSNAQILAAEVDIRPIENSTVIAVTTRSENPELAQALANGLVTHILFSNPIEHINLAVTATLLDDAFVPNSPILPNVSTNMLLGGSASLLIGTILAFLVNSIQMMNVKTSEQIAGVPQVATVINPSEESKSPVVATATTIATAEEDAIATEINIDPESETEEVGVFAEDETVLAINGNGATQDVATQPYKTSNGVSVSELNLNSRSVKVLGEANLNTVTDILEILQEQGDEGILNISGIGEQTLHDIKKYLREKGHILSDKEEVTQLSKPDEQIDQDDDTLPSRNKVLGFAEASNNGNGSGKNSE